MYVSMINRKEMPIGYLDVRASQSSDEAPRVGLLALVVRSAAVETAACPLPETQPTAASARSIRDADAVRVHQDSLQNTIISRTQTSRHRKTHEQVPVPLNRAGTWSPSRWAKVTVSASAYRHTRPSPPAMPQQYCVAACPGWAVPQNSNS